MQRCNRRSRSTSSSNEESHAPAAATYTCVCLDRASSPGTQAPSLCTRQVPPSADPSKPGKQACPSLLPPDQARSRGASWQDELMVAPSLRPSKPVHQGQQPVTGQTVVPERPDQAHPHRSRSQQGSGSQKRHLSPDVWAAQQEPEPHRQSLTPGARPRTPSAWSLGLSPHRSRAQTRPGGAAPCRGPSTPPARLTALPTSRRNRAPAERSLALRPRWAPRLRAAANGSRV